MLGNCKYLTDMLYILSLFKVLLCCSVTQSCPTLQPRGLQHTRLPCPSPTPGAYSNSCSLHWVSDVIQPSHPLSSPSPPAFNLSHHQGLYNDSVLCIKYVRQYLHNHLIYFFTSLFSFLSLIYFFFSLWNIKIFIIIISLFLLSCFSSFMWILHMRNIVWSLEILGFRNGFKKGLLIKSMYFLY